VNDTELNNEGQDKELSVKKNARVRVLLWVFGGLLALVGMSTIFLYSFSNFFDALQVTELEMSEEQAKEVEEEEYNIPREFIRALAEVNRKIESPVIIWSRLSLYNNLVSGMLGGYSPEAAQYAVDNAVADWNDYALSLAKNYQSRNNTSLAEIYDYLIFEHKFTEAEAEYAIENLND
jgi:hypothetical protein